MRHVLIFIFATLVGSLLLAQQPGRPGGASPLIKGTIKGILIDSLSKAPLEYASVVLTLPGGKMLDGVVTEPDGSFRIRDVNTSTYALQCTFLGYEPKTIRELTTTPEHPDLDLGYVFLVPMGINLEEIVVAEEAPIMESKIDKIVYNADKDITNTGGDGADVLRKVPLLSVDLDGNVSLRGNSNVRIFINGKPSSMFAGSVADALKSLPADQIKSVEVITTPTAKYDGEGSTGIINILMKKSELEGLTGSADVSVGTRSNNAGLNLAHTRGRFGINMNAGTRFTWKRPGTNSFIAKMTCPEEWSEFFPVKGRTILPGADLTAHSVHFMISMPFTV
ncbi:MAG: carboxypeptidase regulatory-like domain-containing protein [Saprospiraceae bacterium]|nr:carboxypeptidase regulatory-like domain-containing protein [Saprospiraceae bacterium]